MEKELQKTIERLEGRIVELERQMKLHGHNGFDSGREFKAPESLFFGDIVFPYKLGEKGLAEGSIKTPLGFGITFSESLGASQNGTLTIASQTSTVTIGGTSSNGGVTFEDSSGEVSGKYLKLAHTGNGYPFVEMDTPIMIGTFTTTQRDETDPGLGGIAGIVANGMIIYNSTAGKFQGRAGGAWVDFH